MWLYLKLGLFGGADVEPALVGPARDGAAHQVVDRAELGPVSESRRTCRKEWATELR